ncbi:MAG: glutamate 5-kinase [Pseudomonadota bacterium]
MSHPVRQSLHSAGVIVVKIGSSLVVDSRRQVRAQWLASLARDVADLTANGVTRIIIVSSGAVALGQPILGVPREHMQLADKQAAAAAGQALLMRAWQHAFAEQSLSVAQVLLTPGDTQPGRRADNARATLDTLASHGVIAIVNENDTVATEELRYGDNDQLAARVAILGAADLLVLLSDVDGVYDKDPHAHPDANHLQSIDDLDGMIDAVAPGTQTAHGTGGIHSKLLAAARATDAGIGAVITSGLADHPLAQLAQTERCTFFPTNRGRR